MTLIRKSNFNIIIIAFHFFNRKGEFNYARGDLNDMSGKRRNWIGMEGVRGNRGRS